MGEHASSPRNRLDPKFADCDQGFQGQPQLSESGDTQHGTPNPDKRDQPDQRLHHASQESTINMTAILVLVLKYLPYLVQAAASIPEITAFISSLRNIFKREKVWTPEQEKAFDDSVEALRSDPYWKIVD